LLKPERKLVEIERQILFRDVVEVADNTALEQRPERFNAIRMNVAAHVNVVAMLDGFVWIFALQIAISRMLVGREQRNLVAFLAQTCSKFRVGCSRLRGRRRYPFG
jgi:hypothetical protein